MAKIVKVCEHPTCGNQLDPGGKAKYCSDKCRVSHFRMLKKVRETSNEIGKILLDRATKADVLKDSKAFKNLPPDPLLPVLPKQNNQPKKPATIIQTPGPIGSEKFQQRIMPLWAIRIEQFCEKHGILPEEMIEAYLGKTHKTEKKEDKPKTGAVDYMAERRRLKNGQ